MVKQVIFLCICMCIWISAPAQQRPKEGAKIIHDMHEQYQDTWYEYLTFEQETIFYRDDQVARRQTWYEALALPGQLVIKFDSLSSGTGVVFRQDTQYVFQNNQIVQQAPRVHELLVLGFDVYEDAPAETIGKLEGIGFNLSKTYETEWQGRPVWVVGASGESDNSNQFWIDKERLYFVRLIKQNEKNNLEEETQFNKYEKVGGGWVAPEVLFYRNGDLVLKEVYNNISTPDNIEAGIFDLENFQQSQW